MSSAPIDIRERACSVLRRYPVRRAAIFGSAARGMLSAESDIDILVEFLPGTPGLEFFGLKLDLEDALCRPVDLITYRTLSKAMSDFRQSVEKEAQTIYEQPNS